METIYNADYSEVLTSTAVNNTRGFGGMYLDLYTGLYDDGGRIYTPIMQTFLTPDPAQADRNTYRYVGNDPTDATDPSGLEEVNTTTPQPNPSCSLGLQRPAGIPLLQDLTPNWDQGTGHLRWTEQVYDATIPAGKFTAAQIEAAVYKDLASFKYFDGGNNDLATVRIVQGQVRRFDDPKTFGLFGFTSKLTGTANALVNDPSLTVQLTFDLAPSDHGTDRGEPSARGCPAVGGQGCDDPRQRGLH